MAPACCFLLLAYEDDYGGNQRLGISKDRLAVPSISPEADTEAARVHPNRSRRKKAPRPKSAPKRSSSSPMADYTSPEEEEEEVFSEEEIKLPMDEYEEDEEEEKVDADVSGDNVDADDDVADDDDRQFGANESAHDQVNDWSQQDT